MVYLSRCHRDWTKLEIAYEPQMLKGGGESRGMIGVVIENVHEHAQKQQHYTARQTVKT